MCSRLIASGSIGFITGAERSSVKVGDLVEHTVFKFQRAGIIVEFVPEIESSTALNSSFLPAKIVFEMLSVDIDDEGSKYKIAAVPVPEARKEPDSETPNTLSPALLSDIPSKLLVTFVSTIPVTSNSKP